MAKESLRAYEAPKSGVSGTDRTDDVAEDLNRRELRKKDRLEQEQKEQAHFDFISDVDKALDPSGRSKFIFTLSELDLPGYEMANGINLSTWEDNRLYEMDCAVAVKNLPQGGKEYLLMWTDENGEKHSVTTQNLVEACAPLREELKRLEDKKWRDHMDGVRGSF